MRRFLVVFSLFFMFLLCSSLRAPKARALLTPIACSVSNVLDYVAPECEGKRVNSKCPTIWGTSVLPDGTSYVGVVDNHIEWLTDGEAFKQFSNSSGFIYLSQGSLVRFYQDNVWEDKFFCSEGGKAMYRIFEGSTRGGKRYTQQMSCGSPYTSTQTIHTFAYQPAVEQDYDMTLNSCTVPGQSDQTVGNAVQLIYAGKALCNPSANGTTPFDVIVFQNIAGSGNAEVYVYVKGRGLAAFYGDLDPGVDKNQPKNWNEKVDICDLSGRSQRKLYIYRGIDDQPDTAAKTAMAATYMMTCANNLKFGGDVSVSAEPYSGAQCPDSQACVVSAAATAYINHSATTIPLFRLQDAKAPRSTKGRRTDDLEGFFGGASPELAKAASTAEQFTQPLKSGSNRKSTGAVEQCIRTVNFLKSIQDLCDHEPPLAAPVNTTPSPTSSPQPTPYKNSRCALDLAIPAFEKDSKKNLFYSDVLREVNTINSDTKAFCDIAPPSDPRVWRDQDAKLSFTRELLHRVEIITPKAFKPAYIVRYITSPKLDPGGASSLDRYIAWFAPETPASSSAVKNRIVVSKVFVPANIATADTSGTQNFSSNLIQAISPFLSLDTINLIKKNRDTFEYPAIRGAMNRDITGGAKDYDPQTGSDIVCPECTDPDALETILAKKINADIAFKKGAATLDPYYATLFADEQDLDCTASDITGEKAETKKMTINPTGTGDEVDEIAIAAKAILRYKAGNSHDNLEARTYLLLPEEYRNIRDYEVPFTSSLFAYKGITQPSYVMTSPAPLPSGQTEWAYKYLQMGDTKAKSGNGLSIDISSPVASSRADSGKPTPVYVTGKIVGPELSTFNINPLVPGGKLTRGLWEIMCHILQPYDPKRAYAPYEGFEKFLTKGVASCYTDKAPTQCVPGSDQSPQPVLSKIGNGFLVVAPAKTKLITTTSSELGKKACDWANSLGDKMPAFSINANFFDQSTSNPIGPYGSDGNIVDAPTKSGQNPMSLMVDKNGEAHVYDWSSRSGRRADKTGKPDLSQANFIVTGVYYDNFKGKEAGLVPRTVIGVKDNSLYIRSLVDTPDGVRQAMSDLGIDDGHFVMLDGGKSSQLCQGSNLLYPVGPHYESAGYPQAVSVSMGVGGKATTTDSCITPIDPGETGDKYCIDWEMKTVASQVEQIKSNARSYLTGLDYSYNQYPKYLDAVKGSTFIDFQGNSIPAEKINVWENYYGGGRALLWTKDSQCSGKTCFDYILDICATKGFNPALCVAMNISESGGSNHIRFQNSYDFGCLLASQNDIASGLGCLTNKFFSNQRGKDYNTMFLQFAQQGFSSPSYSKIQNYYTRLSGGIGISAGECK